MSEVSSVAPRSVTTRSILRNLALLTAGSLVSAYSINSIIQPAGFLTGGFSGVAMLINRFVPAVPVGAWYFALNVPLFVLAWLGLSWRFVVYSLAGMLLFSVSLAILQTPPLPVTDPMLAALLGGAIGGFGGGLIYWSVGSVGGSDIISVYLHNRFSLRLGAVSSALNIAIVVAAGLTLSIEKTLYTAVLLFVSGLTVNRVMAGFNQRKAVMIISPRWQVITGRILAELRRGSTLLEGEGAWTGHPTKVVYTVVPTVELAHLKELVFSEDARAMLVINDTMEVIGQGLGQRKVY